MTTLTAKMDFLVAFILTVTWRKFCFLQVLLMFNHKLWFHTLLNGGITLRLPESTIQKKKKSQFAVYP